MENATSISRANGSLYETDSVVASGPMDNPKIYVLSTIIVLTLIGNGYVFFSIVSRARKTAYSYNGKMTRMYYFMLHLSSADILTALLTLLSELIWTFTSPKFYGGNFVCKTVKFLQMIGPYLSSYVLVMTAVDRYQAICHPLTNQVWASKKSKFMIFLAWTISLVLCIPQAIIFYSPEPNNCTAYFAPGWGMKAYVTWFSISSFFVPLLALVFCYAQICRAIWNNFSMNKAPTITLPAPITTTTTRATRECKVANPSDSSNRVACPTQSPTYLGKTIDDERTTTVLSNGNCSQDKVGAHSDDTTEHCHLLKETQFQANEDDQRAHVRMETGPQSEDMRVTLSQTSPQPSYQQQEQGPNPSPAPAARVVQQVRVAYSTPHDNDGGISRAKIRSIQQTVVVILMYISCSTPFICVQLWTVWGSPSQGVLESVVWLFWLLTLNSVVNPFIYMAFNRELRRPLIRIIGQWRGAGR